MENKINYMHPKKYKGLKFDTERNQIRARARVEKYCLKCDKFMGREHDFSECRLVDYWEDGKIVSAKTCPFDSVVIGGDIVTLQENWIKCKVEG